ncbi:response regulator transcription factor [Streptomyces sp. NPDC097107]|uniref:helix-turn-helix transcriptional regulator n=1 Tax=Streptomyces sp. NPDC097107 TaxID=3366089 RepID=UPI0038146172
MNSEKQVTTPPAFGRRRWVLPATLVEDLYPEYRRPGGRPRRSARDWIVDFTCFLLAVVIGLLAADTLQDEPDLSLAMEVADQLVGALACAAVWLRRRWPVGLAVAMVPVSLVSATAGGAVLASLFTLAVHRPFRYVAWTGGASFALTPLFYWMRPEPGLPYLASRVAALNDREREVAVAVGRGLANAAIAAELFMSVATVKTHVSRILAKLDLNNRVQVALLVYDAGLLDEEGEDRS